MRANFFVYLERAGQRPLRSLRPLSAISKGTKLVLSRGAHMACFAIVVSFVTVNSAAFSSQEDSAHPPSNLDNIVALDDDGQLRIKYTYLDKLLSSVVFRTGRSDRTFANKPQPSLGTRVIRSNRSRYRFEGNRIDFPVVKRNLRLITEMRMDLEALPDLIPFAKLSKNEQMAYWINLYNLAVLEFLGAEYPLQNTKKLRYSKKATSLWDDKRLNVSGVPLSLNDIHHRILRPKFKTSLIIYGLWQGNVASPNLLKGAYRGEDLYESLRKNAEAFINSNRGVHLSGSTLKISNLYDINKAFFPDFDIDVKRHILQFSDPKTREMIFNSKTVRANIKDYFIADFYQGHKGATSAANTNVAALVFAGGIDPSDAADLVASKILPISRYAPHIAVYLEKIRNRNKKRVGTVTVEEFLK